MAFLATINIPGYLPMDDDPPTFDTAGEAWEYLLDERSRHLFDADVDRRDECEHVLADRARNIFTMQSGTVYGPTPGYDGDHDLDLAYSVTELDDEGVPL